MDRSKPSPPCTPPQAARYRPGQALQKKRAVSAPPYPTWLPARCMMARSKAMGKRLRYAAERTIDSNCGLWRVRKLYSLLAAQQCSATGGGRVPGSRFCARIESVGDHAGATMAVERCGSSRIGRRLPRPVPFGASPFWTQAAQLRIRERSPTSAARTVRQRITHYRDNGTGRVGPERDDAQLRGGPRQ